MVTTVLPLPATPLMTVTAHQHPSLVGATALALLFYTTAGPHALPPLTLPPTQSHFQSVQLKKEKIII